ncbi:biotin/lipoyl-binding protein [Infirmifilum lucidum]|uniref:Biotin/lipoyl-binding protein n=1 Tax=Infirmifilum lucidum TaxID=2776706 RepID=A0A7L9FF99_9CREN|nr:biotin/lipoyl-containing protein [Infirmifilum lucidum]QOJ78450.1 biotin/lipoyl-binding protein [Infirmifilum lucidum]
MRKKFLVILDGEAFEVEVEVEEGKSSLETVLSVLQTGVVRKVEAPPLGRGVITSPITGRVSRVVARKGDAVKAGDVLAVIEAMKTLVEVRSNASGSVEEVYVKEGDAVKQGDPLFKIA